LFVKSVLLGQFVLRKQLKYSGRSKGKDIWWLEMQWMIMTVLKMKGERVGENYSMVWLDVAFQITWLGETAMFCIFTLYIYFFLYYSLKFIANYQWFPYNARFLKKNKKRVIEWIKKIEKLFSPHMIITGQFLYNYWWLNKENWKYYSANTWWWLNNFYITIDDYLLLISMSFL